MREMLSARMHVELSNPILISWFKVNLNQIANRHNSSRTPKEKPTNDEEETTVNNPLVDCEEVSMTEYYLNFVHSCLHIYLFFSHRESSQRKTDRVCHFDISAADNVNNDY